MESLRNRILTLNEAINTYNNQPSTNSQYMSAHQALCFARNIEAATAEMNTYAVQLEKRDFLEVFSCDVFKTLRESSWLKGMRLENELNKLENTSLVSFGIAEENDGHCTKTGSDLRRWIEEGISAFNAAVKKVKKLTANLPPACFATVYEKQSATVDIEPVQDAYDDWKLGVGKLTFKKLRNYRTKVVADFINLGLLGFATDPVQEELDEVDYERVKRELPLSYEFGPKFKRDCATFRKMMGWKGNILEIDKENYGKYVCMYASKMKPEDLLAFFKLEKLLKLIHEDMKQVAPEETLGQDIFQKSEILDDDYYVEHIGDAIEKVQPYMWGNSANAVIFCALRDNHDFTDNMSRYERVWKRIAENRRLEWSCPEGTLRAAFKNSSFYKLPIEKWKNQNVPPRVMALFDKFEHYYNQ